MCRALNVKTDAESKVALKQGFVSKVSFISLVFRFAMESY